MRTVIMKNEQDTRAFGLDLGKSLEKGDIVALVGDLGTGKTALTKYIAEGLGIAGPITSPTFTVVQEYHDGRLPLYHFDVYRVYDEDEQTIKDNINGSIVLRMHPLMMKKIVFTANEMADELGVHINSILGILNKLVELNIVVKEKKEGTNRITYRYIRVYETFV